MADLIQGLGTAASGMEAQARRLRHVTENIANADTPGYRRKSVSFRADAGDGRVLLGPMRLDRSEPRRIWDPAHPLADPTGHYRGSNVDLLVELADAREAQRSYEANLRMFEQSRQMLQGLLDLLRR